MNDTTGALPAVPLVNLGDIHCQTREETRRRRRDVRTHDRCVKIDLALRNVAVVHWLSSNWGRRVVHAGGEVHVIVAGAAGRARRIGQKCGRLRGTVSSANGRRLATRADRPGSAGKTTVE